MLRLQSVKKHFGNELVLEIPKLDFSPGIYWMKGRNGSGKTTLLKVHIFQRNDEKTFSRAGLYRSSPGHSIG